MPLLNSSRAPWRYVKSRLRLLKRPQAWGTATVLLVAGMVLTNYWKPSDRWPRRMTTPSQSSTVPTAPTPALSLFEPLPSLNQPEIEPTTSMADGEQSDRPSATAEPTAPLSPPSDLSLLGSPPVRSLDATFSNSIADTTRSPLERPASNSGYVFGIDNFLPASPAASPADPLRTAITSQTRGNEQTSNGQTAPSTPADRAPQLPNFGSATPYQTSPPPGTTGYILPPSLTPSSPPSGLPAPRPDVTGQPASSGYGFVPSPTAIAPSPVVPPVESLPRSVPGQAIGNGEINTFANP